MRLSTLLVSFCLGAGLPGAVLAQPAPKPASSATPDPALLKVARETVAQMQGDRTATLSAMAAPMVGMMQQIGIKEPDKAQVLVQEVVMPTLIAHYDELLDIQARGFATILGKDDLQAISTFYATPTGKRLAAAQPQLAQIQLAGLQQWMQSVGPEMQGKIVKAVQAHGWATGGQAKPR
ncbi:DUF2059 domain-containing protein [Methylobacterium sp. J-001]|jgi:hypothetical protein|uniref:DUF2059 domain-containing protein n=1 Tax=Methylobacterium sp. J-001 TaxID=2836609 RepID=UPI001FB9FBE0|nr:DUF2059 domain-containing protein [Methylobacterium sp. J-001]MCJ2115736.1 DUF2059 domain-containing protein [Methylobacterium sp. J-001]